MALISFDKLLKIVSTICNILLVAVKMLEPSVSSDIDEVSE